MINVTKTILPSLEEYTKKIAPLWETGWLTNRGAMALELEETLRVKLNVSTLLYVNNGMIALQIAIKALDLKGEIITTPYSYVATTGAILWENCKPIFVDIEENTFCINAELIEAAITPETSAILATHVYGFPCDIEKIETIAKKHNLKVIYDGAHAFMSSYKGKSLLSFGDISICSFHATKLFHTIEGGAIICNDTQLAEKVKLYHQFGHFYDDYRTIGINGKVSEFHAAMGLCVLPKIDEIISSRKTVFSRYMELLNTSKLRFPVYSQMDDYNYAYFPVIFDTEETAINVQKQLSLNDINSRRYFFPSLNKLTYLAYQPCPVSEDIASRVLCLPFYPDLEEHEVKRIASIVNNAI